MIIQSIRIPGYNWGNAIEFQDTQQDLIEFYLATHPSDKKAYNKNISINCILGDNWCGKSRLFGEILKKYERSIHTDGTSMYSYNKDIESRKEQGFITFNGIKHQWVMLDDWWIGSSNNWYSIHQYLLRELAKDWLMSNYFVLTCRDYLATHQGSVMRTFLDIPTITETQILFSPNQDWYTAYGWQSLDYLGKSASEGGKPNDVNDTVFSPFDSNTAKTLLDFFECLVYKSHNKDNIKDIENLANSIDQQTAKDYVNYYIDLFFALGEELWKRFQQIYNDNITEETHWFTLIETDQYTSLQRYIPLLVSVLRWENDLGIEINMLEVESNRFDDFWSFLSDILKKYIPNATQSIGDLQQSYKRLMRTAKNTPNTKKEITLRADAELSQTERNILLLPLFKLDMIFGSENHQSQKRWGYLSGWEKSILMRFIGIDKELQKLAYKMQQSVKKAPIPDIGLLILIDEPDLHLHLDWQRQYIAKLIDTFSTVPENIKMHFIIATHSPFIISDLPKENIIRMRKKEDGSTIFASYGEWQDKNTNSFGANYVDLIQSGFFDNQILMGSFAEKVINWLAIAEKKNVLEDNFQSTNDTRLVEEYLDNTENTKNIAYMKQQIGDDFLRSHLLYF